MRASGVVVLSFSILALSAIAALANPPIVILGDATAAHEARRREIAELSLRLQHEADLATCLDRLDSEIKLATVELESLRRLGNRYSQFSRVVHVTGQPLLARERYKLDLLAAELRLKDLKQQRIQLHRRAADQQRLNHLLLAEAGAQTAAEPIIVIESHR